jgi:penicillin-binding protein 2
VVRRRDDQPGIGQGYNSFTILQLAHATATLANNGVVMKPHLVKEVEDPITRARHLTVPKESDIPLKAADLDVVKRGMENVIDNPSGTAYKVFRGAQYVAAGKTGTAQVFSLQGSNYKGHLLAEHLRDHALFIAYAPVDHPQIALALVVENGGWGAQSAGPIARRVLDYYLVERQNPKNEAAAVAAAASATEPVSAPVIGDATKPVTVAAGFTALPPPVVPSARAQAASAASAPGAAAAASAAPATEASGGAAAREPAADPAPHRPRRPASDAQPLAAAPRDDNSRAAAAAKAANAGTAH